MAGSIIPHRTSADPPKLEHGDAASLLMACEARVRHAADRLRACTAEVRALRGIVEEMHEVNRRSADGER